MPTTTATELAQLGGLVTTDTSTSTVTVNGTLAATAIALPNNSVSTASISNSSVTAAKLSNPQYTGFRNRIINGDMRIDQRNGGTSVTPTSGQYLVDRFFAVQSVASKYSAQQNAGAVTPPTGFSNYQGTTSLSTYSSASDQFYIAQRIEASNIGDLAFGTASAQSVALSFWVRSSLSGTHSGSLINAPTFNRSYPFTFTVNAANTWEFKTVIIPGDTSGTWATSGTGAGLQVTFNLGSGSSFVGTAGAWNGNTNYGATGAVSVVGTNGATFYITGVQLEAGSTATDFERRPYGTELALCQRYFQSYGGQSVNDMITMGATSGTSTFVGIVQLPVTMRTSPSVGYSAASALTIDDNGLAGTSSAITTGAYGFTSAYLVVTTGATLVTNRPARCYTNGSSARLTWSAEL